MEVVAEIDALSDAVLVFRSVYYPRWKAEVDGRQEPLVPANHAFSGVFLNKGKHSLRFFYDDKPQKLAERAASAVWIMLCMGNYLCFRKGLYSQV